MDNLKDVDYFWGIKLLIILVWFCLWFCHRISLCTNYNPKAKNTPVHKKRSTCCFKLENWFVLNKRYLPFDIIN